MQPCDGQRGCRGGRTERGGRECLETASRAVHRPHRFQIVPSADRKHRCPADHQRRAVLMQRVLHGRSRGVGAVDARPEIEVHRRGGCR